MPMRRRGVDVAYCVPAAECLDSSALGAAQLAHVADESIRHREEWRRGLFLNYCGRSCLLFRHREGCEIL